MSVQELRLMRGTAPHLGRLCTRMAPEERTLRHVLDLQVAERLDDDWLVFDSRDRLTLAGARARMLDRETATSGTAR